MAIDNPSADIVSPSTTDAPVADHVEESESSASTTRDRGGWAGLRRIFNREPDRPESAPDRDSEAKSEPIDLPDFSDASSDASDQTADSPASDSDAPVTMSRQELDRLIQSRSDQIVSDIRKREQVQHQRQILAQQTEEIREELEELRRSNPYAFVERLNEIEEESRQQYASEHERMSWVVQTVSEFDQSVLRPIVELVPAADQKDLFAVHAGEGIEGRGKIASAALNIIAKRAYEVGMEDAERRLRESPEFRKTLLAELRETLDQPEIVNPIHSSSTTTMNDTIRSMWRERSGG